MKTRLYNFLKLGQSTRLRLITMPYQYICHNNHPMIEGMSYGQKLKCPAARKLFMGELPDCPLCREEKSKPRWMIGVINREDNRFYLIDINYHLFSKIRNLVNDQSWGDPRQYDIEIIKGELNDLSVLALPKTFLTAQEELLKSNIDHDYLNSLCDPSADAVYVLQYINNNICKPDNLPTKEENQE